MGSSPTGAKNLCELLVPLSKALYSNCFVVRRSRKAVGPVYMYLNINTSVHDKERHRLFEKSRGLSRCHIPQSPIVLASAGHLGLSLTVRLTLSSMFQCPRAIRFRSERPMGLCDYFLIFYIWESVGRFILDKWVRWDTRFQMWMSIRRFRLNLRVRWDFQIWLESLLDAQVCFSDSEGFSISNPNIRRTFSFKFDSPVSLWNAKGRWVRPTHLNFKHLRTF